jgi:hypothetical protein
MFLILFYFFFLSGGKDYSIGFSATMRCILDMRKGKHSLHFVVDDYLLPHAIVNIPGNKKMHIGVFHKILFIYLFIHILIFICSYLFIYIFIYLYSIIHFFLFIYYVVFFLFWSNHNPYSHISPLTPSTSSKHQMHCI